MEIGKRIQELRKQRNLTQEELGKAAGVSTQAVSRWENGGAPDVMLLPAIADKLGVSVDALFGRDGVQREDPEHILRTLINQAPRGRRVAMAEKYAWTMLKSISAMTDDVYEILSNFEDMNRSGEEGFRMYYCAAGMLDDGLVKAAVAKDFQYALLMPTPEGGFASILRRTEDYLRLFGFLLRPHRLETLVFIYMRRRVAFTASLAAQALHMEEADMEEILRELERYAFVFSNEYETENGTRYTYSPREGLSLIPFLYFASEMMKERDGGGISLDENKAPILNAWPGEGNPYAEWQAGLPDAAAACERDLSGYGLWRYEGNSKGEIKHEQE